MHDLLIENARICDGTGAPSFHGSVAVSGGLITDIAPGNSTGAAARRRIDAGGRVLAPGFVDPHTHYDAQIAWDPLLTCSPWHGVTTVVMGNCGVGVAPVRRDLREIAMWDLVNVEAIPFDVMRQGIDWQWESHADYLGAIEKRGIALNVASLAPLTPLRQFVMGEAAFDREADAEESAQMAAHLRAAMQAGAFGVSTTLVPNHIGYQGRPIACRNAGRGELKALCNVLRDLGRGSVELALGGARQGYLSDEAYDLLKFLDAESGRPITYLALTNDADDPRSYLNTVERLGPMLDWRRVVPQMPCKPVTSQFDMKAPFIFAGLSALHPVFNQPLEEQMRMYRDPALREHVRRQAAKASVYRTIMERMYILEGGSPTALEHARTTTSVADIARARGADPWDTWFDIALEDDLATVYTTAMTAFEPVGVENLLRDGRFLVGLGDAGAHVAQLCDAGYPTFMLGRWVRERQSIGLEEAVRMLTSRPADFFGIARRGRIAAGNHADLTLFDPDTVAMGDLEPLNDLPGGARRLVTRATGIDMTIVGGHVLFESGEHQGGLPGRMLRSTDR
ncbi:MAG: amidohydrolase family protein [Gammaproteobacteria bacterium]